MRTPAPRLADAAAGRGRASNNFDLLRLLGAGLVLFGHSFALLGKTDPLPDGLGLQTETLGVLIFFSISGFLISASWASTPHWTDFVAKRALRLLPGLVVVVLVSAYVIGPLVTTAGERDYLLSTDVWHYVVANVRFDTVYTLPGVFHENPYPDAVNGSLWTLPLELKAYALVLVLGAAGLIAGRARLASVGIALAIAAILVPGVAGAVPGADRFVAALSHLSVSEPEVAAARSGALHAYIELFAAFALAMAMFVLARRVRLSWWGAAACVAAVVVTALAADPRWSLIVAAWTAPYVVLLLAYRTHHLVHWPARRGDFSYGLYLYAFPVQQLVVSVAHPASGWVLFALATPPTALCAIASWHLVEKRALAHRPSAQRTPTSLVGLSSA